MGGSGIQKDHSFNNPTSVIPEFQVPSLFLYEGSFFLFCCQSTEPMNTISIDHWIQAIKGYPLGSSHKDRVPDIKPGASDTDSIPGDNGALETSKGRV